MFLKASPTMIQLWVSYITKKWSLQCIVISMQLIHILFQWWYHAVYHTLLTNCIFYLIWFDIRKKIILNWWLRMTTGARGCGFDTTHTHAHNFGCHPNPNSNDIWVENRNPRPHLWVLGFFTQNPQFDQSELKNLDFFIQTQTRNHCIKRSSRT
jgi:hypothetical protein